LTYSGWRGELGVDAMRMVVYRSFFFMNVLFILTAARWANAEK